MPSFWSPDTRFRTIAWIVGIVLTVVLVGVSARWLGGAPPPNKIVLATGQPGGVYDGFGREYEKRLRAQGLKVELVNTAGSVDNFHRIIEGKADVAFAQSGTYQVVIDPEHKVSVDPPLKFPTLEGMDVPVNEAAETYLTSGESFLSRNLPYRALRWVLLAKILILPLVAIWVPALRLAPIIANWRKKRWLKRYYAKLRDIEKRLATAHWPNEIRDGINDLEALREEVQTFSRRLPLQQQQDVYHWRLHLSLILSEASARLDRMEAT